MNCSSITVRENCDPTHCIWGKTNKCSKKRASKPKADATVVEAPITKKSAAVGCPSIKTKEECNAADCLWGKTNKCSKKRAAKPKVIATLVEMPVKNKSVAIGCVVHKTKEECNAADCFWGKTNKCSKKRIGKKTSLKPVAVFKEAVVPVPALPSGCVPQTGIKKYMERPSPPYSAADCCGMIMKGNDNRDYISVKNVNGICTWKVHSSGTKAVSPRPKAVSPRPKAVSPRPKAVSPRPKAVSPRPKAVSPRPKAMTLLPEVYLESHEDGSNKFYQMKVIETQSGYILDQVWGAIGGPERRNPGWPRPADTFQNLKDAELQFQKTLGEKLKKGYKQIHAQQSMPTQKMAELQKETKPVVAIPSQSDENITVFPPLYGIDSGGKVKIWSAKVQFFPEENKAVQIVEFGQIDGKKQVASREYDSGKGGKSPLEQCTQETKRKWLDKKEKENYKTEISTESAPASAAHDVRGTFLPLPILPMLAKKFEQDRLNVSFPCFVQPKLDGLRCIMYLHDGQLVAQSRTGNAFVSMSEIKSSLLPFFERHPQVVLDGELYTKDIPFEKLAGIIKKQKITDKDSAILNLITYNVYDIVDLKAPFSKRIEFLRDNFEADQYPRIKFVPTYLIHDVNEFRSKFSEFVENGFEGIMLRNVGGLYRTNYRSSELLKYKEFDEDEYPIVGFTEGEGRDKGTVIWICETPDQKRFTVKPRGTIEVRRKLYAQGDSYKGKMLTVIHFGLTQEGIPRFPIGKDIREGY
jgi:predicted DNA-binding WGR domain protein